MTTTLPPCPLCGSAAKHSVADLALCDNRACAFYDHYFPEPSWLALCARLTPAHHVAVPESEIEAVRGLAECAYVAMPGSSFRGLDARVINMADKRALDALIARIPRKVVDHVAALEADLAMERTLVESQQNKPLIAALEAAIVRMRESAP